jgi:hypothetical protein
MQNPFESGHVKNYILLYVGVVVIMILFFTASTLFNDIKKVEKKVFDTNISNYLSAKDADSKKEDENTALKFKLLDKAY